IAALGIGTYATSRANAEPQPKPDKYVAKLPGGIEIELVGVGFHPSQGRQWWKADGSKLDARPYEKSGAKVMPGSPLQADCREFRIEIRGLPREHAVTTDYGPVNSATGSMFSDGLWVGDHAAGPFKGKTTSIRIGLTTEPLSAIQTIDASG